MSASMVSFRSDCDNDYAVDRGSFEKINKQNHRPSYRRSSSPGSVNGIHKRRTSRWTWGHGRGARMENVRAFARCVVMAVAGVCASSALAGPISIETVMVGEAGNAANPSAPANVAANGGGKVDYLFEIGKYEVTNAQYAQFLDSVASISDPNNLYSASMQIARSGSAGSFSYAPTGSNANKPVQFVSFADTFRFANWLHNGMPSGTQTAATTENGSYNMALSQPTRQAGAKYWIPGMSEWYKAAFYNPTLNGGLGGYDNYPTSSNTLTASAPPGGSTSANFNNVVGTTTDVGSYSSTTSAFGAYDMAGNLAERLDTATSTGYFHAVSAWSNAALRADSTSSAAFAAATISGENNATGFRIAAVPEPSTIALTGTGVVSLLIGWRRKQLKARRLQA